MDAKETKQPTRRDSCDRIVSSDSRTSLGKWRGSRKGIENKCHNFIGFLSLFSFSPNAKKGVDVIEYIVLYSQPDDGSQRRKKIQHIIFITLLVAFPL